MQKTLSLIITLAILYMVFQHSINGNNSRRISGNDNNIAVQSETNPKQQDTSPELSGSFLEKTLSQLLINVLKTEEGRMFLENLVTPMDKPVAGSGKGYKVNNDNLINNMLQISTIGKGTDGPVSCGHLVTVKYTISTIDNIKIAEKTETFPLGSKQDVPGLDAVIVGMRVGQARHAIIPSKYFKNEANSNNITYKLKTELLNVAGHNFADENVKIFDDEIAYKLPLLCGQKIAFDAKITKLTSGEILYDSAKNNQKISINIGNIYYPVILSHALHNKIPVGTRTIIAKGRLFKSFMADTSTLLPKNKLPENEYFMLEISNFDPAN